MKHYANYSARAPRTISDQGRYSSYGPGLVLSGSFLLRRAENLGLWLSRSPAHHPLFFCGVTFFGSVPRLLLSTLGDLMYLQHPSYPL